MMITITSSKGQHWSSSYSSRIEARKENDHHVHSWPPLAFDTATRYLWTIWLFTYSDLKTIVLPKTVFGIVNAIIVHSLRGKSLSESGFIATRLPAVLLWVWAQLLPFAINNQRQPASIIEDNFNKPWRPMPTGRLSASEAKHVMLLGYIAAGLVALTFGGLNQYLLLIALGFIYHDLGGADRSWIIRNIINGCGFLTFGLGAMDVAMGGDEIIWTPRLVAWFCTIFAVVTTSIQSQDIPDQQGDSQRGRSTMPLILGDAVARLSLAFVVPGWTIIAVLFWNMPAYGCFIPFLISTVIAIRTVAFRSEKADKTTFLVWNLWVVSIYTLPFVLLALTEAGSTF